MINYNFEERHGVQEGVGAIAFTLCQTDSEDDTESHLTLSAEHRTETHPICTL